MSKQYTNNDVYDFLTEECRLNEALRKEYGKGILKHTINKNFWERLSEGLDCFRICDECGKPMIEGYGVVGCDIYRSDECLYKHLSDETFNGLYDDGNCDAHWMLGMKFLKHLIVTYNGG